jgi:formate hydrogenlyase regulatory protein HycA
VAAPDRLLIAWEDDEYGRFNLVGRYGDGNQFMAFVTGAFPADWWSGNWSREYLRNRWAEHKRWYAVLHRFDPDGNHLGTEARSGGTTAGGQTEAIDRAVAELDQMLASLGPRDPCDIRVRLFGVEIDGYFFGLEYHCADAGGEAATEEYVMLEPNDIMFHPPWASGEYST